MSLADWPEAVEVEGRAYIFASAAASTYARMSGCGRAFAEHLRGRDKLECLVIADNQRRLARAIVAALAARRRSS